MKNPKGRSAKNPKKTAAPATESSPSTSSQSPEKCSIFSSPFYMTLLGGVLMWMAFPPLGWWPLAWVAAVPWIHLVRLERLHGRRPYLVIYGASFLVWMLMIQWIRLPHWSAACGWPILGAYLAVYLVLYIGLTRTAVHRMRVPVIIAAPVIFAGLEFFRTWFLTGYPLQLLAHTQIDQATVVQIADFGGTFAVSFILIVVAACIATMLPVTGQSRSYWWAPLIVATIAVGGTLFYGQMRLGQPGTSPDAPMLKVALVQGKVDTVFGLGEQTIEEHMEEVFGEYIDIKQQAVDQVPDVDLVVWPESMFPFEYITHNMDFPARRAVLQKMATQDPENVTRLENEIKWQEEVAKSQKKFHTRAAEVVLDRQGERFTPVLIGTHRAYFEEATRTRPMRVYTYNTAMLLGEEGNPVAHYDKMYPVLFGEYMPLGDVMPWIYTFHPLPQGLDAGKEPKVFDVNGVRIAPNICFENMVPRVLWRQQNLLAEKGQQPDVLVTITNDGWFWGSNALDLHLACGRFRAIEWRTPSLIAANTGFSGHVDANGQMVACDTNGGEKVMRGPRRDKAFLIAEVRPDSRTSLYRTFGDWPAVLCTFFCGITAVVGCAGPFLKPRDVLA